METNASKKGTPLLIQKFTRESVLRPKQHTDMPREPLSYTWQPTTKQQLPSSLYMYNHKRIILNAVAVRSAVKQSALTAALTISNDSLPYIVYRG